MDYGKFDGQIRRPKNLRGQRASAITQKKHLQIE